MTKAEEKYFQNYAEPEARIAASLIEEHTPAYEYVLSIPAFDENPDFLKNVLRKPLRSNSFSSLLIVLVINSPSFIKNQAIAKKHIGDIASAQNRTETLLEKFLEQFCVRSHKENIFLLNYAENVDILLIDRCRKCRIPYQQGVGLARKIANDCAAILQIQGKIQTGLLFNTDADACLPEDYFERVSPRKEISAFLFPFTHTSISSRENENVEAAQIYHKSLEHYVAGLKYAASPYAFHTIGSTFALNCDSYIHVRGYPKRNAGEDFYLLNKLRKQGGVTALEGAQIELSCRSSHRIPFGTGPSLNALKQGKEDKIFYRPECFLYLKAFLEYWELKIQNRQALIDQHKLDVQILNALLDKFGPEINMHKTLTLTDLHHRFDAFKTLKLIHFLRDSYFPSQNQEELGDFEFPSE